MVSSDTVVGIVGAVILTGAMIAVFVYENADDGDTGEPFLGDGPNRYEFTYQTATVTVQDGTGGNMLGPGQSQTWTFEAPAYVFDMEARITWSETGVTGPVPSGADQFRIELINTTDDVVESDEGRTSPLAAAHGHGTTGDDDTRPPQMNVTVMAEDEAQAEQILLNSTKGEHGVGTWTVRVTLLDTGSEATDPQADSGNDYAITIQYGFYKPVLQE